MTGWYCNTIWMLLRIVGKKAFLDVNDTAVQVMHYKISKWTVMSGLVIHQTLLPSNVAD